MTDEINNLKLPTIKVEIEPTESINIIEENQNVKYTFTTYKTIQDIDGNDVQILDTTETKTVLQMDLEITDLREQIVELQNKIDVIQSKKDLINQI